MLLSKFHKFLVITMMNDLLDKGLGTQYPEELGGTIDLQSAMANTCKFNRWGSLVAVGSTDGKIFICDFLTQKAVKVIQAHVQPISTLSWSRDGRKLLSCGGDNFVKIWDVLEGTEAHAPLRYPQSAVTATFNPRNDNQCVVLPNNMPPMVESFEPKISKTLVFDVSGMSMADDGIYAVSYDRRGKYIIAGSSKGKIIIYDSKTLKFVTYVKQPNSQQIRQIYSPKRGNLILTNTQDRVIRVYRLEDLLEAPKGGQVEPHNKVLDIVNKAAWKSVCTDMEANYICGASMKAHQLYIWERTTGTLMKILTGTKGETILDCQWHPTRPVILSISSGQISVWTQAFVENWSAFAPDFTELEENLKYREKEGEFDDEDEDADEDQATVTVEDDDIEVDVISYKPHELCCSSDEDDVEKLIPDHTFQKGPLWFLPQTEIENPDQPALLNRDTGPMPRLPQAVIKDSLASMIGSKPRRSK